VNFALHCLNAAVTYPHRIINNAFGIVLGICAQTLREASENSCSE